MRITGLELVHVAVNHRGDWLCVRLLTDEGLSGLGEASHGGGGAHRDVIVAAILTEQCRPLLIGADPRAPLAALAPLQALQAGQGLAYATALSACEQALWDLAGQAAGVSVARLFGGPLRERIPLYANINRATTERTPEGFARNAAAAVAEGFRAVKLAPFDGMDRRQLREPDQRAHLHHGLACVAAVRAAIGTDIACFVDCHSRFDLPTALEVAAELRRLGVWWFEEPVPTEDLAALRALRPLVPDLELIGGEHLYEVGGFWPYLVAGVWDRIMPDVKHCGGIAAAIAIGRLAEARGVAVHLHSPSGPVSLVASAHVAAALPQPRLLEYAWDEVPWRGTLVSPGERIEQGELILPAGPGLGIALDDATITSHS
jgi:galactonate dehydratase